MIDTHGSLLNSQELFWVRIEGHGPVNGVQQIRGGLGGIFESATILSERIEILDRIIEAARRMDNRQRAVPHAVQLAEAARLDFGRHQEDICPGINLVSKARVETEIARELFGPFFCPLQRTREPGKHPFMAESRQ